MNTKCTAIGIVSEKGQRFLKAVFRNDRVGVQEKNVFSGGLLPSKVAGFRKSRILTVFNEFNRREKRAHVGNAVVGRIIVYNEHFRFYTRQGFKHGIETLLKEIPHIVIHYDDG